MEAVVCGIDPGLRVTGYAVLRCDGEQMDVVDAGVFRFDDHLSLPEKLVDINRDVSSLVTEHDPDVVAVEQLYAHYAHPRTAILMGHARGVILRAVAAEKIDLRDYAATQVKRFVTGNGRASKGQRHRGRCGPGES